MLISEHYTTNFEPRLQYSYIRSSPSEGIERLDATMRLPSGQLLTAAIEWPAMSQEADPGDLTYEFYRETLEMELRVQARRYYLIRVKEVPFA